MSLNTSGMAAMFQTACDQQIFEGATSGWMEQNAGQVKYSGGHEIKIPTLSTTGLGNYDRDSGYPKGKVMLSYQTMTMTMDRAASFLLDRIDVDESNFIAAATNTVAQFQRENVIPEVDSYRYSKLFELASGAGFSQSYTAAKSTIFDKLQADITAIYDQCGSADLVITMPYTTADILDGNEKFNRVLNVDTFTRGNAQFTLKTFNGIPIIRVPSARMMTKYDFKDGSTEFGFEKAADAKQINWIICPRTVPIAVCKTDGVKIFDPEVTQGADAWTIEYRKFHDLWVTEQKLKYIRVSVAE